MKVEATEVDGRRVYSVRAFNERAAINARLQGSAADIIRRAMVRMEDALAEKKLSAPLDTPAGVAVVRVLEKKSSDETALAQQRDSIRESLLAAKKDRLFSSYLQTLTDRYPITRNAEALAGVR